MIKAVLKRPRILKKMFTLLKCRDIIIRSFGILWS